MSSVWTSFSTLSSLYWTYAYETQPRHLVEVRWISVFFFFPNQQKATTMVSCLYLYLFSVRSSKVFYVQLIFVKRWQLKNIKNCNIEVDQVHQLLKTKKSQVFFVSNVTVCANWKANPTSVWLSNRASERGIRRSEVRFLTGTWNLFFVPRSWQDEKYISLILHKFLICNQPPSCLSWALLLFSCFITASFVLSSISELIFCRQLRVKGRCETRKIWKIISGNIVPYHAIYTILFT